MLNRGPKKNQITPDKVKGDQSTRHSSFIGRVSVPKAAKTSVENHTSSTPCTPWWYRLFGRPLRKDRSPSETVKGRCSLQQRAATTAPPPEEKNPQAKKKKCWRLFNCCRRRRNIVAPVSDIKAQKKVPQKPHSSPVKSKNRTRQPNSSIQVDPVVEFHPPSEDEDETNKDVKQEPCLLVSALIQDAVVKALCQRQAKQDSSSKSTGKSRVRYRDATQVFIPQSLRGQQVCWLGFPNPAQICYATSSFQSIFTLAEFVRDVNCQEDVWSLVPEAELMSRFMNIVRCRSSADPRQKLQAFIMFKRVFSVQAPEFVDNLQKDAHEFLTTILGQMRSLTAPLQDAAAQMRKHYICPVENNLVFKMQNTRTCNSCGAKSIRIEEFTSLSLDLVPGGSVEQMLQEYQSETQLDYNCECGGKTSGQRSTFLTLPRILILHLKRFRFTPSLQIVKLHDPVILFRELMVTSSQADGWYSLVSVISHIGCGGSRGHYISDGLHPDEELDAPGDKWLHYNDAKVKETTGTDISERRQRTAYILFYQRRL